MDHLITGLQRLRLRLGLGLGLTASILRGRLAGTDTGGLDAYCKTASNTRPAQRAAATAAPWDPREPSTV
jgi:hypothetical protein